MPGSAAESFAGAGNPVCLGEIHPGETVLDLGSGAGSDCFLAATRVGSSGRVVGDGVQMTAGELGAGS